MNQNPNRTAIITTMVLMILFLIGTSIFAVINTSGENMEDAPDTETDAPTYIYDSRNDPDNSDKVTNYSGEYTPKYDDITGARGCTNKMRIFISNNNTISYLSEDINKAYPISYDEDTGKLTISGKNGDESYILTKYAGMVRFHDANDKLLFECYVEG